MNVGQVLRPGDQVVFEETVWTVSAVGSTVRLTDCAGRSQAILLAVLLSAPGFELLGSAEPTRAVRLDPLGLLDALPESVVARAREWEGHVLEVETGLGPRAIAPRAEFDPASTTVEQRDAAKAAELTAAGWPTSKGSVKRMRLRYRAEGLWGLVDHRYARVPSPHGRVDERVVAAAQAAIAGQTTRSTGTKARLWRQVQAAVEAEHGAGVVPLPSSARSSGWSTR